MQTNAIVSDCACHRGRDPLSDVRRGVRFARWSICLLIDAAVVFNASRPQAVVALRELKVAVQAWSGA